MPRKRAVKNAGGPSAKKPRRLNDVPPSPPEEGQGRVTRSKSRPLLPSQREAVAEDGSEAQYARRIRTAYDGTAPAPIIISGERDSNTRRGRAMNSNANDLRQAPAPPSDEDGLPIEPRAVRFTGPQRNQLVMGEDDLAIGEMAAREDFMRAQRTQTSRIPRPTTFGLRGQLRARVLATTDADTATQRPQALRASRAYETAGLANLSPSSDEVMLATAAFRSSQRAQRSHISEAARAQALRASRSHSTTSLRDTSSRAQALRASRAHTATGQRDAPPLPDDDFPEVFEPTPHERLQAPYASHAGTAGFRPNLSSAYEPFPPAHPTSFLGQQQPVRLWRPAPAGLQRGTNVTPPDESFTTAASAAAGQQQSARLWRTAPVGLQRGTNVSPSDDNFTTAALAAAACESFYDDELYDDIQEPVPVASSSRRFADHGNYIPASQVTDCANNDRSNASSNTADAFDRLSRVLENTLLAVQSRSVSENPRYLNRMTSAKKLPEFSGNPLYWLRFQQAFDLSRKLGEYSEEENVMRLFNSLKDETRDSTSTLFASGSTAREIMSTLERRFGDRRVIIEKMVDGLRFTVK